MTSFYPNAPPTLTVHLDFWQEGNFGTVPVNLLAPIAANLRASSSIDFPFERFVVEDWPTPLAKAKEDPQRSSRVKFIIFFFTGQKSGFTKMDVSCMTLGYMKNDYWELGRKKKKHDS